MGLYRCIALFLSFINIYPENCILNTKCEILRVEESKFYNKYLVRILETNNNLNIKNTKLIAYIDKKNNFKIGDIIELIGDFKKAEISRNYKGFNYRNYLKQEKIYGIVEVKKSKKVGKRININYINQIFLYKIREIYKGEYSNFLEGLLLGNKAELSDNIKNNFKNSSLSHILAISGMHVSYVILGINFILKTIIKDKNIRNYIIIIFLIFFSIITGFSSSCVRACFMSSMVLISSNLHRKNIFYISYILSFIFLIMYNPYNLFNVGMWLSYSGTLGIVIMCKLLFKIIYKKFKDIYKYRFKEKFNNIKFKEVLKKVFKNIFFNIINCFSMSLSSQIFIFPIVLYNFNTVSFTFFISNILVSFFIGPIIILGYISLFIGFFILPLSKILANLENILIQIIFKISEICSEMIFSKIYLATPNFSFIFLYYLLIIIFIYYFKVNKYKIFRIVLNYNSLKKNKRNSYVNKSMKNKLLEKNIKIHHHRKINSNIKDFRFVNTNFTIILCSILIIILIVNLITILIDKNLKIYFVDVGQGDCTLIISPENKKILIDGGEGNSDKYDYGENVVFPYLLDRGIMKIDYVIISHCDSDHIGGLFAVIKKMKIGKILIGKQYEKSKQLNDLINLANEKNIDIIFLESNMEVKIDKNIYIKVLWPNSNYQITENNLNNNSLVFKLFYKDVSMLFTGDIEKKAEEKILNLYNNCLNSTIIKVGHHGSNTSSTDSFIKCVNPKIALIGVGKNNYFGHPNEEILERLKNIRM